MSSLAFHALRVGSRQPDAEDAVVLTFDVPPALADAFRFEAGQHLTLRAQIAGHEVRRSYSICSAPGEPLRVGVRRVAGGVFSNWLHTQLQAGDRIEAMAPLGRFGAALAARPRHVLAVAGGSGITPILAILQAALAGDAHTRCTLLYGNRSAASTMFADTLADLKNRHLARLSLHSVYTREVVDAPWQAGRIDADTIATLLRLSGAVDAAFVCGPHAMNDAVQAALQAAGVPAARIHVERFGVPPEVTAPAASGAAGAAPRAAGAGEGGVGGEGGDKAVARIHIVRDGLTREIDFLPTDANVLAAAVRAGLDMPYSCQSGVCATCRARVQSGQLRMARNFALSDDEVAAGFVLTCQASPLTDRVSLSFDER
jgi:ring-1,2-phenylacetyl-CoA epoxidase subunit PaaE